MFFLVLCDVIVSCNWPDTFLLVGKKTASFFSSSLFFNLPLPPPHSFSVSLRLSPSLPVSLRLSSLLCFHRSIHKSFAYPQTTKKFFLFIWNGIEITGKRTTKFSYIFSLVVVTTHRNILLWTWEMSQNSVVYDTICMTYSIFFPLWNRTHTHTQKLGNRKEFLYT